MIREGRENHRPRKSSPLQRHDTQNAVYLTSTPVSAHLERRLSPEKLHLAKKLSNERQPRTATTTS
ncbi:hypothetical protein SAMN04487768_0621 [Burkholderia sp. b13]|nr:hypothetical protein SAMN04487768_0621 [Burkholderia sp. b13]